MLRKLYQHENPGIQMFYFVPLEPTEPKPDAGTRWYAVQSQVHAEPKAAVQLQRQGFGVYLPRYLKSRRHARRVDTVAAPLFPRYLFVSVDTVTQRWHSIKSTIGVTRLVSNGDVPAVVSPSIIIGLKHREGAPGFVQVERRQRFPPGEKVRVLDGAFSECLGLFEAISGHD